MKIFKKINTFYIYLNIFVNLLEHKKVKPTLASNKNCSSHYCILCHKLLNYQVI